ncbi:histidine phosphatase family protein [Streptomyces sp. NPDC054841]
MREAVHQAAHQDRRGALHQDRREALHGAGSAGTALPSYSRAVRGPSLRCAQTAAALGVKSTPEPALRDFDYGTWRGRTVDEITATDPHGIAAWLTDPDAAPHGGESVRQLCRRTADWLSTVPPDAGRTLAIAEPAVVRASLIHALSAPAKAFWHLDVPPLTAVSLTSRDGCWNVRLSHIALCRRPGHGGVDEHVGARPSERRGTVLKVMPAPV